MHTAGPEAPDCLRRGSGSMPCKAPTGGDTRGVTRRTARGTPARHKRGTFPFLTTLTLIPRGRHPLVLRIVLATCSSEFCPSIRSQDVLLLQLIILTRFIILATIQHTQIIVRLACTSSLHTNPLSHCDDDKLTLSSNYVAMPR